MQRKILSESMKQNKVLSDHIKNRGPGVSTQMLHLDSQGEKSTKHSPRIVSHAMAPDRAGVYQIHKKPVLDSPLKTVDDRRGSGVMDAW